MQFVGDRLINEKALIIFCDFGSAKYDGKHKQQRRAIDRDWLMFICGRGYAICVCMCVRLKWRGNSTTNEWLMVVFGCVRQNGRCTRPAARPTNGRKISSRVSHVYARVDTSTHLCANATNTARRHCHTMHNINLFDFTIWRIQPIRPMY